MSTLVEEIFHSDFLVLAHWKRNIILNNKGMSVQLHIHVCLTSSVTRPSIICLDKVPLMPESSAICRQIIFTVSLFMFQTIKLPMSQVNTVILFPGLTMLTSKAKIFFNQHALLLLIGASWKVTYYRNVFTKPNKTIQLLCLVNYMLGKAIKRNQQAEVTLVAKME